jgi:hypothetical protein
MDTGPLSDTEDTKEMTPVQLAERDAREHYPKVKIILTGGYYRTLRLFRYGCSVFVALLVVLLKQVAPTGFAVIVAVLAGVGLYAMLSEVMFQNYITEDER